jgi:hypothetical protein
MGNINSKYNPIIPQQALNISCAGTPYTGEITTTPDNCPGATACFRNTFWQINLEPKEFCSCLSAGAVRGENCDELTIYGQIQFGFGIIILISFSLLWILTCRSLILLGIRKEFVSWKNLNSLHLTLILLFISQTMMIAGIVLLMDLFINPTKLVLSSNGLKTPRFQLAGFAVTLISQVSALAASLTITMAWIRVAISTKKMRLSEHDQIIVLRFRRLIFFATILYCVLGLGFSFALMALANAIVMIIFAMITLIAYVVASKILSMVIDDQLKKASTSAASNMNNNVTDISLQKLMIARQRIRITSYISSFALILYILGMSFGWLIRQANNREADNDEALFARPNTWGTMVMAYGELFTSAALARYCIMGLKVNIPIYNIPVCSYLFKMIWFYSDDNNDISNNASHPTSVVVDKNQQNNNNGSKGSVRGGGGAVVVAVDGGE